MLYALLYYLFSALSLQFSVTELLQAESGVTVGAVIGRPPRRIGINGNRCCDLEEANILRPHPVFRPHIKRRAEKSTFKFEA